MKNTARKIVTALEKSGVKYEVLNVLNGSPQHVRVPGFGDVYPSTGTWQDSSRKWHKKNPDAFLSALARYAGSTTPEPLGRIQDLEMRLTFLESEIDAIKAFVGKTGQSMESWPWN